MNIDDFRNIIWKYYREHRRILPWRKTHDPYKILVSEVMLQQTQVSRTLPKYQSFLKKFPTVRALADARLGDVLREWQGLGYNRRAIFLKRCAEKIIAGFGGKFPKDLRALETLPGIGPATAGDLMAFAWNIPVPVIETNIRSVFLHFFFPDKEKVRDADILPLVEAALDRKNPRDWYYALFDYGAYLKKTSNPSQRSAHHAKQSKFSGSHRQKRARMLRLILDKPQREDTIKDALRYPAGLIRRILGELEREGFIRKTKSGRYTAA